MQRRYFVSLACHTYLINWLTLGANQDGQPYILRCVAGPAVDDARSQGYTLAAQTTFSSLDDMKYYDNECEAHAALKAVAKEKVAGPPLMVCFDNAVGGSA